MNRAPTIEVNIGDRVGDWLVLGNAPSRNRRKMMLCHCTRCGAVERPVGLWDLRYGKSTGCGCYRQQALIESRIKHAEAGAGGADSPTYVSWQRLRRVYRDRVVRQWSDYREFLRDVGHRPAGHVLTVINKARPILRWNVEWRPLRTTSSEKGIRQARRRLARSEARRGQSVNGASARVGPSSVI